MKNFLKYNYLFAVAALGVLSSCNDDDDSMSDRLPKSEVSLTQTSFSVTEGETVTLTLNTDQPLNKRMDFKLEISGGTSTFRDYVLEGDANPETDEETTPDDGWGVIGHKISLPAYQSSHTVDITPVIDFLVEGNETIVLKMIPMGNANGSVAAGSETITINVADYVSNDVGIKLIWDQNSFNSHGNVVEGVYEYMDGDDVEEAHFSDWDFDIYLEDAGGADVTGYAGATGNSPEFVTLDATLPDGDYFIYVDLWSPGPDPIEPFDHDLKISMSKYGVWSTTVAIPTSSSEVFSDYVLVITKTGNNYTVTDYATSDVIVSGRKANMKEKIKALKKMRNKK